MRNLVSAPTLESVDRALQLAVMLRDGQVLSVKAAAEHLGVSPSTAHRLLTALCYRDFAAQDRERRYRAGAALVQKAQASVSTNALRHAARPALQKLRDEIGDTVQLMVLAGANIRFIDGIESDGVLRVAVRIGDQMPAYCSAGGKAMLAELGTPDLDQIHRGGLPPWPTARITTLQGLKRELTATRKAGYGTNTEETEQGVSGLGVCIRDPAGSPIAAFTTAIPSARFSKESVPGYVKALRQAAAAVEEQLAEQRARGAGETATGR